MAKLLENCPFHTTAKISLTGLLLKEGPIQQCQHCKLNFSSCSQAEYLASLETVWGHADRLDPDSQGFKRLKSRRRTDWKAFQRFSNYEDKPRHLDIGCATGTTVSIFESFGADSFGIDPSEQPIKMGKMVGRNLAVGYLEDQNFSAASFDLITMYEVIEHIKNPKEVFSEISRILKPGGVAIIGTGNLSSWTKTIRGRHWDFFNLQERGGHICYYSPKIFRQLAPEFGLKLRWANTYSVKFFERHEVNPVVYHLAKFLSESLSLPSSIVGKGHQMECFFVKNSS